VRFRLARITTRAVNALSRRLGRGQGTVAGGRVGLAIDHRLLEHLTAKRAVALVTGTNGKTTTTRLLTVALSAGAGAAADDGAHVVLSNETGSNMPAGHVAALVGGDLTAPAVLEVDEIYLSRVLAATSPTTVVLLNLSRDQLDRTNEVRMVAGRWRAALAAAPHTRVVANADDPLVAWGAGAAAQVDWVAAGLGWQLDAVGCPSCDASITFTSADDGGGWFCGTCGFARPVPTAALDLSAGSSPARARWADGRTYEFALALPGRFNDANALMAAVAATHQGIEPADAFAAMAAVEHVAGRFATRLVGGVPARLMLAKNPAGWSELLALVGDDNGPLVVAINARTADGADPSWLWDVPFERLAGRGVVATGDRCRDLSVRLKYAGVTHVMEEDRATAVATAVAMGSPSANGSHPVDVIGNYTAFHDFLVLGSH